MPSKKRQSKLSELIQALRAERLEVIPEDEGWFTTIELADELGCSVGYASKMLLKGQTAGTIEMKRFRVDRNGALRVVPHFRKK